MVLNPIKRYKLRKRKKELIIIGLYLEDRVLPACEEAIQYSAGDLLSFQVLTDMKNDIIYERNELFEEYKAILHDLYGRLFWAFLFSSEHSL